MNSAGYSVTKLATTGGFLRTGNMTLLTGVEDSDVDGVIEVLKGTCSSRSKLVSAPMSLGVVEPGSPHYPIEVSVGGATIFVVDVDRFEKI